MLGRFGIDVYEYPPPFLLLPGALRAVVPGFPAFRLLWFVLNGVVVALCDGARGPRPATSRRQTRAAAGTTGLDLAADAERPAERQRPADDRRAGDGGDAAVRAAPLRRRWRLAGIRDRQQVVPRPAAGLPDRPTPVASGGLDSGDGRAAGGALARGRGRRPVRRLRRPPARPPGWGGLPCLPQPERRSPSISPSPAWCSSSRCSASAVCRSARPRSSAGCTRWWCWSLS